MTRRSRSRSLLLFLLMFSALAVGQQVGQLSDQYGAAITFPEVSIDTATLVPTFHFPVISKTGAIPFSLSIVSPQVCQIDVTGTAWGCSTGGSSVPASLVKTLSPGSQMSAVSYVSANGLCPIIHVTALVDPQQGYHAITPVTIGGSTPCGPTTASVLTTDNSHISATVTGQYGFATRVSNATFPNGYTTGGFVPPFTITDTFNNTISDSGVSTGTITDTLGTSTLTYSTSGYSYKDANGATQNITYSTGASAQFDPYPDGLCNVSGSQGAYTPITAINYPDGTSIGIGWDIKSGTTYSGLIGSITLRTGGTISYKYTVGAVQSCTTPKWWFSQLIRTTPDGPWTMTTTGLSTTVLDPGQNKTVYTFVAVNPGCSGIYCVSVPVITQIQKYQNTGTVMAPVYTQISSRSYCYNNLSCTTVPAYPISQRDVYEYLYNGATQVLMSHTTELFDSAGNTTSTTAVDSITPQTLVTTSTFSGCGQGATILDHPCDVKTTNGGNTIAETKFTYNTGGALQQTQVWTGSIWLPTNFTPNTNGTIASVQDPNGQTFNIGYSNGCNNVLPTSTSATVGGTLFSTAQTWNCDGAVLVSNMDVNGNTPPNNQYDAMLRPTYVANNAGYGVTMSYPTATATTYTPSLGATITDYVDNVGRPANRQSAEATNYDTVSASYSLSGPNSQIGASPLCLAAANTSCTGTYNNVTLDPIGRIIAANDVAGGSTSYTYSSNTITETSGPAPTSTAVTTFDGFGRNKSIVLGNNEITTTLNYTFGAGSSTTTATRGQQTHTSIKDGLGRTTSVQIPEAGTMTNQYDSATGSCGTITANGDLVYQTTAAGKVRCYSYDGLHRVTDVNGVGSYCRRLRYDKTANGIVTPPAAYSGTNLIGRLMEAETDNCSGGGVITDEWFSYNKDGKVVQTCEYTPVSKVYYCTSVTYYADGTLNTLSGIPGNMPTLTYSLDAQGRWNTAKLGTATIVASVNYTPGERDVNIGPGTDKDQYLLDGLGRVSQYQFFVGSQNRKGVLGWSQNGTLGSLTTTDGFNSANTQTCNFGYDDMFRLTSDNCGTVWSQTYSYVDQYENINKSGSASWIVNYNPANNQFSGIGATYDGDGNLTYDGTSNHYTWDAFGLMATAMIGSTNFTLTYDALGQLVANGQKEIIYSPMGKTAVMYRGSLYDTYIPLPGGGTMVYNGSTAYLHNDWLNSAPVGSYVPGSGNGTLNFDVSFSPYGDRYNVFGGGGANPPVFGGDTSELVNGLYEPTAREFTPIPSRFPSCDPVRSSWNCYAYPTNPNSQIDPSGLRGCDNTDDACVVAPADPVETSEFHWGQVYGCVGECNARLIFHGNSQDRVSSIKEQLEKVTPALGIGKLGGRGRNLPGDPESWEELKSDIYSLMRVHPEEEKEWVWNRAAELAMRGASFRQAKLWATDDWIAKYTYQKGELSAEKMLAEREMRNQWADQAARARARLAAEEGEEGGIMAFDMAEGLARSAGAAAREVAGPAILVLGNPITTGLDDLSSRHPQHIGVNRDAAYEPKSFWDGFVHAALSIGVNPIF